MTITFPALSEAEAKLSAKQKALASIFEEAGPELDMSKVKSLGDSVDVVDHIRQANAELTEIGQEVVRLREVANAAQAVKGGDAPGVVPGDSRPSGRSSKTFGDLFVESAAYRDKTGDRGPEAHLDIDLKALAHPQNALFETGAGWAPETTRTGRVVEFATRPLQVVDVVPIGSTSQAAVVYMEETTFTNNAAEIAEGGTYPESALALTERSSPVRKVGTWLPVTDEQLEDEAQAAGYVNRRLPFMVRQRLDAQILVGNGTAPNLRGFLNTAGIQTQAKGADPTPDAVYKAIVKVETVGQAMPNAVMFNPLDWQDVRLLRTTEGIYIWGSPSEQGPAFIWGLPVVTAQALTENTALVGDFLNYSELAVRRGIDVQITNSHSTFFIEGKQAIRADMRAALVVYRPAAFCTVTGV